MDFLKSFEANKSLMRPEPESITYLKHKQDYYCLMHGKECPRPARYVKLVSERWNEERQRMEEIVNCVICKNENEDVIVTDNGIIQGNKKYNWSKPNED